MNFCSFATELAVFADLPSCQPYAAFLQVSSAEFVCHATFIAEGESQPDIPVWRGDERVMYGCESSASLTTGKLHYKLQTRPLVREDAPRRSKAVNCPAKEQKKKNLVMDTKMDRLTDRRSQLQLDS
jgi:hypothetical protein